MTPRRAIEPSVGFQYPTSGDGDPTTAQREAVRLLAILLDGTRNARITAACLRHLADPRGHTITRLAHRLGVHRVTLHREFRRLRKCYTPPL